jgi:hypothetical protein
VSLSTELCWDVVLFGIVILGLRGIDGVGWWFRSFWYEVFGVYDGNWSERMWIVWWEIDDVEYCPSPTMLVCP